MERRVREFADRVLDLCGASRIAISWGGSPPAPEPRDRSDDRCVRRTSRRVSECTEGNRDQTRCPSDRGTCGEDSTSDRAPPRAGPLASSGVPIASIGTPGDESCPPRAPGSLVTGARFEPESLLKDVAGETTPPAARRCGRPLPAAISTRLAASRLECGASNSGPG